MPRISKRDVQKILDSVPGEFVFWCQDGNILNNMADLGNALSNMAEETFAYHANQTKNDFSNWVKDIIKDEQLASDLLKATNRQQAAAKVAGRLAYLRKRF